MPAVPRSGRSNNSSVGNQRRGQVRRLSEATRRSFILALMFRITPQEGHLTCPATEFGQPELEDSATVGTCPPSRFRGTVEFQDAAQIVIERFEADARAALINRIGIV